VFQSSLRISGPDLAGGRHGAQWCIWDFRKEGAIPPIELRGFKIEGFGGRPPVGGRPGARGPRPPKSGPEEYGFMSKFFSTSFALNVIKNIF